MSPALCLTNSSGQRSASPTSPSSDSTRVDSSAAPSASPRALNASASRRKPKVRADASSRVNASGVMS